MAAALTVWQPLCLSSPPPPRTTPTARGGRVTHQTSGPAPVRRLAEAAAAGGSTAGRSRLMMPAHLVPPNASVADPAAPVTAAGFVVAGGVGFVWQLGCCRCWIPPYCRVTAASKLCRHAVAAGTRPGARKRHLYVRVCLARKSVYVRVPSCTHPYTPSTNSAAHVECFCTLFALLGRARLARRPPYTRFVSTEDCVQWPHGVCAASDRRNLARTGGRHSQRGLSCDEGQVNTASNCIAPQSAPAGHGDSVTHRIQLHG